MALKAAHNLAFALGGVFLGATAPLASAGAQTTSPPPQNQSSYATPFAGQVTSAAKQADVWYNNYLFRSGEVLPKLRLHYVTLGTPHRNAQSEIDNAILLLHWTGASGATLLGSDNVKVLFDPGCPLDARRYYLIVPDNFGHGQSSKPSDGLRAKFPHYRYADLVDLQHKLVAETLGITHLHAVIGMSMGGMNAWQWAEAYPNMLDGVMPVVSLPVRVSGRNLVWRRLVIDMIRSDPQWDDGNNYTRPPIGWLDGFEVLRMMIDGVPHFQATVPDQAAAEKFLAQARRQSAGVDANDNLYSLEASADYDPEPSLGAIKTKLFALNFSDDEFNPDELHILENLMPEVKNGRYVVQPGTSTSFGHLTMARPDLWADHVVEFMHWLGDSPATIRSAD